MPAPAKPLLAVTMGDPAGIGPEVIVGAWANGQVHDCARLFVVGHPEVLRRAARLLNSGVAIESIESLEAINNHETGPGTIFCMETGRDVVLDIEPGQVDARAGAAAYQAVRRAATLALEGEIDGLVTAPLSKSALHAAGHYYPGHTELLAEICGAADFAMML